MKFPITIALFPNKRILIYDLTGLLAWLYGISKLFIIDVDRIILGSISPGLVWLLDYRFIFWALVLAVLLLVMKPAQFLLFALYVISFPIIVVIWKLPVVFARMRTWVLRLAALNAILTVFTDFRYKVVYFVVCSVGIVLISIVGGPVPSAIGIGLLAICIIASHARAFINAFRPPRVLRLYRNFFLWAQRDTPPSTTAKPKLKVPVSNLPAEKASDYMTKLQEHVFLNRASLFFAEKLQEYQRSEIHVIGGISSVAFLIAWTLMIFTFLYMACIGIDPLAFGNQSLTTFELFHVAMVERSLGWFLIAIFLAILIEIRRKKHSIEIDEAISAAKAAGAKFELSVVTDFSYKNIDEAISDLASIESSLYSAFLKLAGTFRLK